jgi:flavin reductase (DIM6/NTAB) family NADH-FMN oxidoreductase RutF
MFGGQAAPVDAGAYRRALRHHPGGVAVVTAATPAGPAGCTVTSLTAASLSPPLVSFYLDVASRSLPAVRAATHFGVHLLAAGQHRLAQRFSTRQADRFAPPTRWWSGPYGVPLLGGVTVRLVCARHSSLPVGDHVLVVGLVVTAEHDDGDEPLLYAHGRFGHWLPIADSAELPAGTG